ncbi:unnamed protein product [Thlaspi arvense]|uniref:DUF1985 domain-containing protein n=1 Tax=Thlaspi arvense TaxID=13288 RepID=A0AAU9SVF9_THLAR|nr:unnamed protein product [Thlaspi arvense]
MDITLPKLKYKMGKEPMSGFKAIDKYSDFKYIAKVKEILGPEQFKRIEDSCLGPVLQFFSRKPYLAGQMIHTILTKSLITKTDKELWFHFRGHPMRFSRRKFHMVMGLKCTEWLPAVEEDENNYDWAGCEDGHSPDELIELMIEAGEDAHDERFSLAMLLLIEIIFLHRYSKARFPTSNLQKAQQMDVLLNHHWGMDAYELLLKSVKKTVQNSLEKAKYPPGRVPCCASPMDLGICTQASVGFPYD